MRNASSMFFRAFGRPAAPAHAQPRGVGLVALCVYALIVGFITSIGAAILRALIALVHNGLYFGKLSAIYDANVFDAPSPFGAGIILLPVIGGLVVVWLVRSYAPEAKGHGVPEVMDAIFYKGGRIRMAVIFIKSLASAISIGSGASVGREGPIIQIGSGIGSTIGQFVRLPAWQVITLVAAGGGAGIAATFNTPLGGLMFAVELMLPEVSTRTFLPVVIATGAATYFGWLFFGVQPAFIIPLTFAEQTPTGLIELVPIYFALGIVCGLAATLFVRGLYWTEDLFEEVFANAYLRNVVGMLVIGLMLFGLERTTGHSHVGGVGYASIQAVLTNEMTFGWLLLGLFVAKLAATCISLGAGASGGIFAPSLFMGTMLGGAFGVGMNVLFPQLGVSPAMTAIVGMAAIVGSGTGAAMTAILMVFEMTQDYRAVVPSIIAVAIALGVRRALSPENIYTMKLTRRGHHIPKDRHSHMFMIRQARDVALPVVGIVTPHALGTGDVSFSMDRRGYYVVADGERIVGLLPVTGEEGERDLITNIVVVRGNTFLRDAMARMGRKTHRANIAIVVDRKGIPRASDVKGVLTRRALADVIIDDLSSE